MHMENTREISKRRIKNNLKSIVLNPFNLMTLLCIVMLVCLVIVPLISLVKDTFIIETADARRAKAPEGSWSLYYWNYLLMSKMSISMFWKPLLNSLIVSVFSCLIAVPLGAFLAWLMVRSDLPGKEILSFLIIVPYMVPSWCKAQAWLALFRNSLAGGTPGLLYWLGVDVPDWIAYGPFAMICVLSLHYYAFAYILISGALSSVNSELEEMAMIQGAGNRTIVSKITLPLVMPAILSALIMTLTKSLGGYSVASYLGTRVKYFTLATRLHDCLSNGIAGVGYGISVLLILLSTASIFANNKLLGTRKSYSTINGKGGKNAEIPLGKTRYPLFVFVCVFLFVAMVIPIFSLVLESFQISPQNGLSPDNLTLFNWIGKEENSYALLSYEPGLFRNTKFLSACWKTLKLGILGALISTCIGQVMGYISVRGRGKWYGSTVDQLAFVPYLIPSIAFSAVYISMFMKPMLGGLIPGLYGTFALILMISVVKYFPYASRAGSATMMQINSELEESAEINGAGFFCRFFKIVFPLAKNGIMSGFILTFINITKEFDLISLVITEKNTTLSYLSFQFSSMGAYPLASATSVVMIVIVSICYFLAKKLFGADLVKSMG